MSAAERPLRGAFRGTVTTSTPVALTLTPPAVRSVTPGVAEPATVTITTDIPSDSPHTISANAATYGASLEAFTAAGTPVTTVSLLACGTSASATEYIMNSGDASFGTPGVPIQFEVVASASNPAGVCSAQQIFTVTVDATIC